MAGLFRAPKPVVVPPQAPAPSPEPAPVATPPAQAAEAARTQSRAGARQGIQGTIATSARGVLAPLPVALTRKSLLGE
ncbi:hypothetical protein [Sediminicoccus rosea]|jgi:hypothetical protein|uniref:Uncharacterized protein n=1 Tax=Sediminicoccus rosea TaxID=1225128 RepID=A0ABZ0PFQ6_9PROT|nr:hypothetical protein [Sediminicoccus rosea]WPB84569.1 hypothetical protein R9Z33_21035 [Sediminicoccus rosea]